MIRKQLSSCEIAERGNQLYEQRIKQIVEPEHIGRFLVLDIDSGEYEIDDDHLAASDRAAAKHPDGIFYALRIGDVAVGRIGAL